MEKTYTARLFFDATLCFATYFLQKVKIWSPQEENIEDDIFDPIETCHHWLAQDDLLDDPNVSLDKPVDCDGWNLEKMR